MELWRGELPEFINRARSADLAREVARAYRQIYRRAAADTEYRSWEHSLSAMANVADEAATDDIGVLVEYHLPLSERRIDVMLFGQRADGSPSSLLVELKRWNQVQLEDEFALNVLTGDTEHVHPSQQALDYAGFLTDAHSEYSDSGLAVQPCSYCHDLPPGAGSPLVDRRFANLLGRSPVFLSGDEPSLAVLLNREVGQGGGVALMHKVRSGLFRPSKQVIAQLDAVLRHDDEWHLLDEQRKAFNTIWAEVKRAQAGGRRSAVLVRGGPGTGKSVIAVQLLSEALRAGLSAAHATGGKAFTTVLRGTFTGAQPLFIWNRHLRNAAPMGLDLLLADEAHRIRETSDDRYTQRHERGRRRQVDEMIDAARVSVFLLDEYQYMRPDEVGSTKLIRQAAEARSVPLREYDLATQFRCGGCREYVDWLDYFLGFSASEPDSWYGHYGVEIVTDAAELDLYVERAIVAGDSARLVAGFCWKWSKANTDGSLVEDVVIGDWRKPWNRKAAANRQYPPERHPYTLWATTAEGQQQVGCIYSIQGFEFDRVGVIWGPDLVWRDGTWVGQKKVSKDPGLRAATPDQVTQLIRHAYRVLLTRGMKGTAILCLDEETRDHLARAVTRAREQAWSPARSEHAL